MRLTGRGEWAAEVGEFLLLVALVAAACLAMWVVTG